MRASVNFTNTIWETGFFELHGVLLRSVFRPSQYLNRRRWLLVESDDSAPFPELNTSGRRDAASESTLSLTFPPGVIKVTITVGANLLGFNRSSDLLPFLSHTYPQNKQFQWVFAKIML